MIFPIPLIDMLINDESAAGSGQNPGPFAIQWPRVNTSI